MLYSCTSWCMCQQLYLNRGGLIGSNWGPIGSNLGRSKQNLNNKCPLGLLRVWDFFRVRARVLKFFFGLGFEFGFSKFFFRVRVRVWKNGSGTRLSGSDIRSNPSMGFSGAGSGFQKKIFRVLVRVWKNDSGTRSNPTQWPLTVSLLLLLLRQPKFQ